MPKSKDAFRTISEVADWLEVQPHVLRFWESKFSQVRPVKRAGGRRYYRPADMQLIGGIKRLLHDDGMTIKGVQKILREKGVKEISALSAPIDDEDSKAVEHIADPAPVTEADLIGDLPTSEAPETAEVEVQADVVPEPAVDTPLAETVETAPIDAAPTAASPSETDAPVKPKNTKPKNPLAGDSAAWEVRRKIIARLTEITALQPSKKAEISTAVAALAELQAARQKAANP
ncbi:MAG: MerR family transcriptional regulator [Cognatishimia sp.]|uniref:MerR family transcriptional regulator n=1 Tax=Cognatishimia sp. TaxID=2211648 RepID=UPI003B8D4929